MAAGLQRNEIQRTGVKGYWAWVVQRFGACSRRPTSCRSCLLLLLPLQHALQGGMAVTSSLTARREAPTAQGGQLGRQAGLSSPSTGQ